jgi:hypothetical protein
MEKNLTYKINIDGDIGKLESKLGEVKGKLSKLTEDGGHPEILKLFETIEKSIDKLKHKAS